MPHPSSREHRARDQRRVAFICATHAVKSEAFMLDVGHVVIAGLKLTVWVENGRRTISDEDLARLQEHRLTGEVELTTQEMITLLTLL